MGSYEFAQGSAPLGTFRGGIHSLPLTRLKGLAEIWKIQNYLLSRNTVCFSKEGEVKVVISLFSIFFFTLQFYLLRVFTGLSDDGDLIEELYHAC